MDESHGWFWGRQLEEAISEFLEAAKTAEQIDGDKTVGPGAGGTNIVGLIIHSSAVEMLPILKSITAFDSSWPASGFLGANPLGVFSHVMLDLWLALFDAP